jgi:MFS family permease
MNIPFPAFWCLALVSNIASGAQAAGVMWLLGDPNLQPWVLVIYQLCGVAGTFTGVAVGSQLIPRLGHRKTLLGSSALEALFCLFIGLCSYTSQGSFSESQAYLTAICCMGMPFAAGIGGPAWVALISCWPGTNNQTRQLLRDNVQFQLGMFTGPILGGAALAATPFALQWLSAANAGTYIIIAVALKLMKDHETGTLSPKRHPQPTLRFFKAPPLVGIIGIALAADSARLFLARLIREANGDEFTYTVCLAILALSSAGVAAITSWRQISDQTASAFGLFGIALGLATWSSATYIGLPAWLAGAALIGASVALSYSSLTSLLMQTAGADNVAAGAAIGLVARTLFGSIGGLILGALVPAIGGASLLLASALALGAASYVARKPAPRIRDDSIQAR